MLVLGLVGGFFAGLFVPANAKTTVIDLCKKLYKFVVGFFNKAK